jgi:hypothetical protein
MKTLMRLAVLGLCIVSSGYAVDQRLDGYLRAGEIDKGLVAFAKPADDAGRFSLGMLQLLQGLQAFSADAAKLGVKQSQATRSLPFFRILPRSTEGDAEVQATPEKVRALFKNFREAIRRANATLASVGADEFKVQVNLSQIRLTNIAGVPGDPLINTLGAILPLRSQTGEELVVNFDSADAVWLKGYTHFIGGSLDVFLAYDWQPVWDQCAHLLFHSPNPLPPISQYAKGERRDFGEWADLIAALHEMRLNAIEPTGIRGALAEFRAGVLCSRLCWERVLAEEDDDHEWLPSPRQTGPAGSKITQAEIDGWRVILDEVDGILAGKKLLPHWRLKPGSGINLARLAAQPPKFDLVLIVQGAAILPYVETGDVSDQARWRTLTSAFGSGFLRFALWSN